MREDLTPALESRGAAVLYVDLWADRALEPGLAIVSLVGAALAQEDGALLKVFRKACLDKVNVGGLGFDVAKVGLGTGVTLSAALATLSDRLKAPIVLMIDEAQHAATTESGNNALFALKAARNEFNSSAHHGLRIVATGSSRPKLALLRASKDQAFFKAMMRNFPALGRDYVTWFVANTGLPHPLDVARTEQLGLLDPSSTVKVDVPNVQSALEALQGKSLAWRAAHGEYALEDQGLVELMRSKGLLA